MSENANANVGRIFDGTEVDIQEIVNIPELREIFDKADAALKISCEAKDLATREKADADMAEAIEQYAKRSKALTYQYLNHIDGIDPMKAAILLYFYPVIKMKQKKEKDSPVVLRYIEYAQTPIDLGDLHNVLKGIGANPEWIRTGEELNFHMSYRAAERVGAESVRKLLTNCDAFNLHKITKQRKLGKNPCSNTQMLKTMQLLITEMLGDGYKATSRDVNFIFDIYATNNKKSKTSITLANHKAFRDFLKKSCYRILTGAEGYDVEQKEIRIKK